MTTALSFPAKLREAQAGGEDHEWYPTTNAILEVLAEKVKEYHEENLYRKNKRFLDVGAGDGKVLDYIRAASETWSRPDEFGPFYAIEKSAALQQHLDPRIYLLGCDLMNTSLYDKDIDMIYCNPPYSQFSAWITKILGEMDRDAHLWACIPTRWTNSEDITGMMAQRGFSAGIHGEYFFAEAEERKARAAVHLVHFQKDPNTKGSQAQDPFEKFFDEQFQFFNDAPEEEFKDFDEKLEHTQMTRRTNFVEALCFLHDQRILELQRNYKAICQISLSVLKEFGIERKNVIESLRQKLTAAKSEYWTRLFDGMTEITRRLTWSSREKMLSHLTRHTGVDFTRDNAYAIVLWAIKNANQYFDPQLIETYEKLVDCANVENYVSNKRVLQWERFSYHSELKEDASHYRLKVGHRIVLERMGGLDRGYWGDRTPEIKEYPYRFIMDLMTVAENLGFTPKWTELPTRSEIASSDPVEVRVQGGVGKKKEPVLIRFRAFLNGNLHLQFLPEFIHALNTAHGRLKGWLRDDAEAAKELEIEPSEAAKFFKNGFRLEPGALKLTASDA